MHAIRMFNVVEYIAWQGSFYLDSSEIIINRKRTKLLNMIWNNANLLEDILSYKD